MSVQPRTTRRGLLTLAALAVLPAACSRPATPGPAPAAAVPPAPLPPSPFATPSSPAATASASAAVRASAKPEHTAEPHAEHQAPPRGGPVAAKPGHAMLGSYVALSGQSLTQSLRLRREQLGRNQAIVHVFYGWTEQMPTSMPAIGDSTLMISWHGSRLSAVTDGSQDAVIKAAATRLARYGKPVLLRWAWEMNGNWFDWDGTHNGKNPEAYVRAHRHIHRIFRDNGAGNVAFVWSPNWNSGPDVSWNRMENYYPGDTFVDWVGVSGYDFDGESPRTLFRHITDAYGARKPIILSETAAVDHGGRSKADWISALSTYVRRTPSIEAVVWFDTDTQDGTSDNFRFDTSSSSLAAYRAMARSSRFSG